MLGVVVLHYNVSSIGGGFAVVPQGSINEMLMYFLESLCIAAVDIFVLITGYFMANTKKSGLYKPFYLVSQVIFLRVIFYIVDIVTKVKTVDFWTVLKSLLPMYWFVSVYIALYLLAPFINGFLNILSAKKLKIFLLCLDGVHH